MEYAALVESLLDDEDGVESKFSMLKCQMVEDGTYYGYGEGSPPARLHQSSVFLHLHRSTFLLRGRPQVDLYHRRPYYAGAARLTCITGVHITRAPPG